MSVKIIDTTELREMSKKEVLILQGCGGELKEWIDGINQMFTENEILLEGTKFREEECYAFRNNKTTCLLFPFSEDVKLNMGKLAIWRIGTHHQFAGTWLSDYVPNYLGGFIDEEGNPLSDDETPCDEGEDAEMTM